MKRLECSAWIDFVRRLPCAFCERPAPSIVRHCSDDDSRTFPVCARCNAKCETLAVSPRDRIDSYDMHVAAAETRSLFLDGASPQEWESYCAARRRAERGAVERSAR